MQLTTDGHKVYLDSVEGAFGNAIDYAMLVKMTSDLASTRPFLKQLRATCDQSEQRLKIARCGAGDDLAATDFGMPHPESYQM